MCRALVFVAAVVMESFSLCGAASPHSDADVANMKAALQSRRAALLEELAGLDAKLGVEDSVVRKGEQKPDVEYPVTFKNLKDGAHKVTIYAGSPNQMGVSAVELPIGTPPQIIRTTIDTGSPSLFVPSSSVSTCPTDGPPGRFYPDKSSTYKAPTSPRNVCAPSADKVDTSLWGKGGRLKLPFGSQIVFGECAQEKITYDSGSVDLSMLVADSMEPSKPGMTLQCALIGFGLDSLSVPPVLEKMGLSPVFALDINLFQPVYVNTNFPFGSLVLGGVDADSYKGGLACVPLLPEAKQTKVGRAKHWQHGLQSVEVGGERVAQNQQLIADTGTSSLIFGSDVYSKIEAAWAKAHPGKPIPDVGNIECELQSGMPDIVITLPEGSKLIMPPSVYMSEIYNYTRGDNRNCVWNILSPSQVPGVAPNVHLLGTPLFQKYIVVHDFNRKLLAYGLKKRMQSRPIALRNTCQCMPNCPEQEQP